jgi:hypothetical protein
VSLIVFTKHGRWWKLKWREQGNALTELLHRSMSSVGGRKNRLFEKWFPRIAVPVANVREADYTSKWLAFQGQATGFSGTCTSSHAVRWEDDTVSRLMTPE